MPVEARVEVFGVRDALTELGKVDKKQKFRAIAKVKAAGGPLLEAARENYPSKRPVSGWGPGGRLGYDPKKVERGVQLQIGGRAIGDAYAIVTIVQKNAGGALFDIAGFADGNFSQGPSGDALIAKLNSEYGRAQRGMWRNIAKIRSIGTGAIEKALQDVVAETNRNLVVVKRAA